MSQRKMVYLGEWVRVRNMGNKYFRAGAPCSVCKTFRCEVVWYSIRTREVRCTRCFDAELGRTDTGPVVLIDREPALVNERLWKRQRRR